MEEENQSSTNLPSTNFSFSLIKEGEVIKMIVDESRPVMKKVMTALGVLAETAQVAVLPVRFFNTLFLGYGEKWLKLLTNHIEGIPEENVIGIQGDLLLPALEKLFFTSNEKVAGLFVNLLGKAANSDTARSAHPGFLAISMRLSEDEIEILKLLIKDYKFPTLKLYAIMGQGDMRGQETIGEHLTDFTRFVNLTFPDNIPLYLNNLASLGLLRHSEIGLMDKAIYAPLFEIHDPLKATYEKLNTGNESVEGFYWQYEHFEVTSFGRLFIETAIKDLQG